MGNPNNRGKTAAPRAIEKTVSSSAPAGPSNVTAANPTNPTNEVSEKAPIKVRSYFTRYDQARRDIVISASGVERNLTEVTVYQLPNKRKTTFSKRSIDYNSAHYDFITAFGDMSVDEKAKVMKGSSVELLIHIKDEDFEQTVKSDDNNPPASSGGGEEIFIAPLPTVVDQLDWLGPEFGKKIGNLCITLYFRSGKATAAPATSLTPASSSASEVAATEQPVVRTPFSGPIPSGAMYKMLEKLVEKVNTYRNIKGLCVVMNVDTIDSSPLPVTNEELLMVLPFYKLRNTHWPLLCQDSTMEKAIKMGAESIEWLDKAFYVIKDEKAKVEKEQAQAQREQQDSFVIRHSLAPIPFDPLPVPGKRPAPSKK